MKSKNEENIKKPKKNFFFLKKKTKKLFSKLLFLLF